MQRFFDILFSSLALIFFSFPLVITAVILRYTGEGEVFFLQERIGKNGKRFNLLKFATMLKNSPNIGSGTITIKNDPRILPAGRFLRSSKINELPQLINIFLGDMSIIGPRPMTEQTFNAYTYEVKEVIKKVKPGLSGIGSIVFRNEEDLLQGDFATENYYQDFIAPYKGELECWYVKNNKLSLYLKLIFITAWVVCIPRSKIVRKFFKELPLPPENINLNF